MVYCKMEDDLSFGSLVDNLQSVRKDLEVLRQEHENIIEGIFKDKEKEEGKSLICFTCIE